jgi:hypothetical protein
VEPNRQRVASNAEHLGGLPQLQPFPGHQQQQLSVSFAQAGERGHQAGGLSPVRRGGRRHHVRLGRESIVQAHAATLAASVVGQHVPSGAQQPRQRVLRQLGAAPPRHQEHVSDNVIGRLGIASTHRVATHRTGVNRIERLKLLFDPHDQKCPPGPAR